MRPIEKSSPHLRPSYLGKNTSNRIGAWGNPWHLSHCLWFSSRAILVSALVAQGLANFNRLNNLSEVRCEKFWGSSFSSDLLYKTLLLEVQGRQMCWCFRSRESSKLSLDNIVHFWLFRSRVHICPVSLTQLKTGHLHALHRYFCWSTHY